MRFEVFHPGLLGRPDVIAVDMIHYPGLWGLCFSHHPPNNNHPRYGADTTTAGVLRFLEAAQEGRDGLSLANLADYIVTTHHVDADAVLPVWALLHPEAALARRDLLERIARCGDFFLYLDEQSARINAVIEGVHWRLRGAGRAGDRLVEDGLTRACFEWLLPRMEGLLDDPEPYREFWEEPLRTLKKDHAELQQPGRVREYWDQHLSWVETDHEPDAHALNTICRNDLLLVWRTDKPERRLEVRPAIAWYEMTSLPHRPHYNLAGLAERLNNAEGRAAWTYQPGPVRLRCDASLLRPKALLRVVHSWLKIQPETLVPAAYRADVREVFSFQKQHSTLTAHRRFADVSQIRYRPGAPYQGLHFLGADAAHGTPDLLWIETGKQPLPFAVADDFYWNRAPASPLHLAVTYVDTGRGTFWVEYDAWENPLHPTPQVTLCGDGQIRTATFDLQNARLGASQLQGADLRLRRAPGTPLALKELTLCKEEPAS